MILALRNYTYQTRQERFNLFRREARCLTCQLIKTSKTLKGLDNVNYTLFQFKMNKNHTRNCGFKLLPKHFKTRQSGNLFSYKILISWNQLPDEVSCNKVYTFKTKLDKTL